MNRIWIFCNKMVLARRGSDVCISARNEDQLQNTLIEMKTVASKPDQVFSTISLDVTEKREVDASAEKILEKLGGLDLLINNAGISHVGLLDATEPEDYIRTMNTNYFGTAWNTLAFLPHFQAQRCGVIAGVSSTLGCMGLFGYSAYSASKFAVTGFYECLHQDLLKYEVQVSVIFPADTDTSLLHEENRNKPVETRVLAGHTHVVSPEFVAITLLDGITAGKYEIIPGFDNKFFLWVHKKMPYVLRWYINHTLKKL